MEREWVVYLYNVSDMLPPAFMLWRFALIDVSVWSSHAVWYIGHLTMIELGCDYHSGYHGKGPSCSGRGAVDMLVEAGNRFWPLLLLGFPRADLDPATPQDTNLFFRMEYCSGETPLPRAGLRPSNKQHLHLLPVNIVHGCLSFLHNKTMLFGHKLHWCNSTHPMERFCLPCPSAALQPLICYWGLGDTREERFVKIRPPPLCTLRSIFHKCEVWLGFNPQKIPCKNKTIRFQSCIHSSEVILWDCYKTEKKILHGSYSHCKTRPRLECVALMLLNLEHALLYGI